MEVSLRVELRTSEDTCTEFPKWIILPLGRNLPQFTIQIWKVELLIFLLLHLWGFILVFDDEKDVVQGQF